MPENREHAGQDTKGFRERGRGARLSAHQRAGAYPAHERYSRPYRSGIHNLRRRERPGPV